MVLNINKPIGWTSFDVVKKIRFITKEKKVGHGGTLDPFANGVLIVATGRDTKQLTEITGTDKSYIATIRLGEITNTLDTEGIVTEKKEIPSFNDDKILKVLNTFLGETKQIPPMFSAKKIKGKKLYELARKNIEVERMPVLINIKKISLLSFNAKKITFSVTSSKGTYIRVLGKDIAEKLGTLGYLTSLKRTKVGSFSVADSTSIEEFEEKWKLSQA
ncbi:MAG: tRNA pseudouridine(55) synthase TruB [Candidatus Marinimicrobia bacterium]|nr:tRNA pseudouridine(55) synthase TruB [Candidatus Neomarinimicrobiota bacterium]